MSNVKSITPIRFFGAGNNGAWGVRLRMQDGTELFAGVGAGHTLAQAQRIASVHRDSTPMRDPITGVETQIYLPLPAGVEARA